MIAHYVSLSIVNFQPMLIQFSKFLSAECTTAVDVVFMIDSSGSVNKKNFLKVMNFVREMASRLNVDDGLARVAVLTFNDTAYVHINFTQYKTNELLTRAIQRIEYGHGRTEAHGKQMK